MVNIGNDIDFLKIGRKTQMIHIRMYMCVKCGYILSFNFIQSENTAPKIISLNVRASLGGRGCTCYTYNLCISKNQNKLKTSRQKQWNNPSSSNQVNFDQVCLQCPPYQVNHF